MVDELKKYLVNIQTELSTGNALEHTYRPALKILIESLDYEINAVNEPSRSEHGAPDFIFLNKNNRDLILGYAETKDLNADLDKIEKSEQLKRYLGYPNLILTNYLEFRFFRNGEKYQTIKVAEIKYGVVHNIEIGFLPLVHEIKSFLSSTPEQIKSAEKLAKIMGGKASRIRENVERFLKGEKNEKNQELFRIYGVMKELLVHDLKVEKFADMYAQTLVYGLFVARYYDSTPNNFSRAEARDLVPASNPFLREFFDHIAGANFDSRLKYIADELCAVFSVSDIPGIMKRKYNLFEETVDKDPIIHFYEDFLFEYDPELKKQMGAYYTPVPVVQFMVRAVDEAIKKEFGLTGGISDSAKIDHVVEIQGSKTKKKIPKVQILDPAVGTATFLNEIIKFVYKGFANQQGMWGSYVESELLPRLNGFELMMAPYTIAHLKLALTLKETGINDFQQRLRVYLTNTLEEGIKTNPGLFDVGLVNAITNESAEASRIKHDTPIMVVMGNPPYSGISSNMTEHAGKLIEKYKIEPGGTQKLQERKHWLNDDYVKFIAFAEEMINKTGEGIVAMITNHGYIDNPTFRGMRWHLCKSFSTIYILDLHGNAKKKEISPDGSPDKNVFDIQQGVSIMIGIKKKPTKNKLATVYRADLYGTRKVKFDWLNSNSLTSIKWEKLVLSHPSYLFLNLDKSLESVYETGIKVNELFPTNTSGIVTARDSLVVAKTKSELLTRMYYFFRTDISDSEVRLKFFPNKKSDKYIGGDSRGWKLSDARKDLTDIDHEQYLQQISYRPFDSRWIYYHKRMVDWCREKVMKNFLNQSNIGLVTARGTKNNLINHFFITESIAETKLGESSTQSYTFPLYVYDELGKVANIDLMLQNILLTKVIDGGKVSPEDLFDYVYATLHSPSYRDKYKDFLKSDFPRIPVAKDNESFWKLVELGGSLRRLHLLDEKELGQLSTTFPLPGSNEALKIDYKDKKVYINESQYFDGVSREVFDFYIGGYQPAQKWLKDRKNEKLEYEDIKHYQQMIASISKTMKIMTEIDLV